MTDYQRRCAILAFRIAKHGIWWLRRSHPVLSYQYDSAMRWNALCEKLLEIAAAPATKS